MLLRTRTRFRNGMTLLTLVMACSVPAVHGASLEEAAQVGSTMVDVEHHVLANDLGVGAVCESPRCSDPDGGGSCTACRVWDYAFAGLDVDAISCESRVVENGVVLRVTAEDPHVQQVLWTISVARHHILDILRRGGRVPLCDACQVNVQAFSAVEIGTSRLPNGVLLMYTSNESEVVETLHMMVLVHPELPL